MGGSTTDPDLPENLLLRAAHPLLRPEYDLGVTVPLTLLVARTDSVAVVLRGLTAFANGFSFSLDVLSAEGLSPAMARYPFEPPPRAGRARDHFRFGLRFADGSRVDNAVGGRPEGSGTLRVLVFQGSTAGEARWTQDWWTAPLPPPPRFTLACEWPTAGLAAVEQDVPTDAILEAAACSRPIWP
jgi:hypothetical protein